MSNKTNGELSDWARSPPRGTTWQRVLKSIYDPEEKSFLGRTAKRWGIVLLFYAVFYAVLALMFALCMGGLFLSLDEDRPTYTLKQSLIGSNPGVAFRPRPIETTGVAAGGVGLKYETDNSSSYQPIIDQLDVFFEPYKNQAWFLKHTECVANDSYGYPNTPCFYVKINKIIGWQPELYDDATALPEDMPEDLVEYITLQEKRKKIWISCAEEGSNSTKIEYPWGRSVPGQMYPYTNVAGYNSPVVAVRLTPTTNKLVFVRCRAWAKNIIYNKSLKDPSGYTRIQIYIEDSTSVQGTTL